MKLIIGGYSQGKLNYTLRKIGEKEYRICDGTLPEYTKIDTAEINIIKSDTTNTIIIINSWRNSFTNNIRTNSQMH